MPADAESSAGSDAASHASNEPGESPQAVITLHSLCRRSEFVYFDPGDAGPILTGDDDRPDLLKNAASLQDAVFGVSHHLAEYDAMRWQRD